MELVHYKILELPKTATESEIKKSYRGLARKYHPDLSPDDKEAEKKFKEINEANEVLSNPESRKKYDKYGKEWKHADEFEKQGYGSSNQQHYNKQNQSSGNTEDFYDFSSRCMVLMAVETVKESLKDRISMQNCI